MHGRADRAKPRVFVPRVPHLVRYEVHEVSKIPPQLRNFKPRRTFPREAMLRTTPLGSCKTEEGEEEEEEEEGEEDEEIR